MIPETDEVLVNRNGTTYKTTAENMANLEDTDLMLVNRDGVTYTVTGEEIKESIQTEVEPEITSVVLTQDQVNADRYTSNSFTTQVNYVKDPYPPAAIEMTAKVSGVLGLEVSTDVITSNNYVGTSSTSVPLALASDVFLTDGTFEVGDEVKASESYTPETSSIDNVEVINVAGSSSGWASGGENLYNGTGNGASTSSGSGTRAGSVSFNPALPAGYAQLSYYEFNGSSSSVRNMTVTITYDDATSDVINTNISAGNTRVHPVDSAKQVKSIGWSAEVANESLNISQLKLDLNFIDVSDFSKTVLTLPDTTDIKLFQVGDVVQGGVYDISTLAPSGWKAGDSDASNVFDGDSGTLIADYNGGTSRLWELTTPIDLDVRGQTVEFLAHQYNKGDSFECQLKFSGGTSGSVYITNLDGVPIGADPAAWITATVPEDVGTKLTGVFLYSYAGTTHAIELFGVRVNGQVINFNDGTFNTGAGTKVVATDVAAKTITVDGGNWDTSNQSQVWSNGTVTEGSDNGFYAGSGPEQAFDGDLTTQPNTSAANNNGNITWTLSPPLGYTSSVRAYSNGNVSGTYSFNGGAATSYGSGWITLATGSGSLSSINTNRDGDGFFFSAIEVDGEILVDPVNDSSVWSGGLILPDGLASGTYANQFDGNLSTYANPASASNSWSWLCPETIVLTENIKLKPPFVENFNYTWSIGGNNGSSSTITDTGWYELQGTAGKTLSPSTPLVIGANTSSVAPKFTGMMVNGILLVDAGVRDIGDTKVSTSAPKQGQGTISNITGSNVTIEPYTDNCFKEGQHLTHVTPKPILVTPISDSITFINNAVNFTFSGNKDLLQFAAGDPVTMTDANGTAATALIESSLIESFNYDYDYTTLATNLENQQFIFDSYSDDAILTFAWIQDGANGGTSKTDTGNNPTQGGNGGSSGSLYYRQMTLADYRSTYGNSYTYTSSGNNFGGTILINGGSGSAGSNSGYPIYGGLPSPEAALTTLNDALPGTTWSFGDPGVNGSVSTSGSGRGGAGAAGYNVSGVPELVATPTAGTGGGQYSGGGGTGGSGWGAGGGGGGGTDWNTNATQTYPGGSGASGAVVIQVSVPQPILTFTGNTNLEYFKAGDQLLNDDLTLKATALSDANVVLKTLAVDGGTWDNTMTAKVQKSGTGTIDTVDPVNNTMTLSDTNGEWVTGYHVTTPEKNAIEQTGYLVFGSSGNVTGVTLVPQPAVQMSNPQPVLTFPSVFGTGTAPDTELPYPTSLQTTITAENMFVDGTINTSTVSSNILFPNTTTYVAPAAGTSSYTGAGVAQLTANLTTFSGREAAANTDPTDVQGALTAKQTEIDDYIAGL